MGLFRDNPENIPSARCEMCELLASAYATGAEQLLQAAMWVDRATRFSEPYKVNDAVKKVNDLRGQVEQAWTNYNEHRAEHADSSN